MLDESNPIGRPTVMTEEVLSKLEAAFLIGCSDKEACLSADISLATLYNYQKEHPEFIDRKETLKENPVFQARKAVVQALSQDHNHALRFLERKNKAEFAVRTEHTGENGKPIQVEAITGMQIIEDRPKQITETNGDTVQDSESEAAPSSEVLAG